MAESIDKLKLSKTLGRHTRVGIPFSWTIGGSTVDLEADGYEVRVWVTDPAGTENGPYNTTVSGDTATYQLSVDDLDVASADATSTAVVVAVAENGTNTLVSDGRAIVVGDWGGADNYTPSTGS